MPRTVRDSSLETRSARSRLKATAKPYFRMIEPGLHIGYRKRKTGPGSWVVRRYAAKGYTVLNLTTEDGTKVIADDFADADGGLVLNFAQAQRAARGAYALGSYTVKDALDGYFTAREHEGRDVATARQRANAWIYPELGDIKCDALKAEKIRGWLQTMASSARRQRTKKGQQLPIKTAAADEETKRRRRSSANRVYTTLRAALNHAFRAGKIASDKEWRQVKAFGDVDEARPRYLALEEATRLMNACPSDFRLLVQAALLSGARYGQLCRIVVRDFNSDAGTLTLRSKKGKTGKVKTYHAMLDDDGFSFFKALSAGRASDALFLAKSDGSAWSTAEQIRRMGDACRAAKITPPMGFHGLRHTWASHAVMNGIPLLVVAQNLGHADTRMVEKHYGHLAPSYRRDVIRANAPRFGIEIDPKIVRPDFARRTMQQRAAKR
ncbi:integrase [Bradyrhizobium sp. AZCC 1578]|uniref:tyrosine-type recombinase/integrase n=1 Tax=Bradyrhizobium sp. AZCC 1578 TaxID=3117027 RepID=UPI002FF14F98